MAKKGSQHRALARIEHISSGRVLPAARPVGSPPDVKGVGLEAAAVEESQAFLSSERVRWSRPPWEGGQ